MAAGVNQPWAFCCGHPLVASERYRGATDAAAPSLWRGCSRPCCWSSSVSTSWGTTRPPWRRPACPSPSLATGPSPGRSRLPPPPPPSPSASRPPSRPPSRALPQVGLFQISFGRSPISSFSPSFCFCWTGSVWLSVFLSDACGSQERLLFFREQHSLPNDSWIVAVAGC